MDKALYIAMTGAKHNMLAQSVRANNLANVNTDGFRADFEQARSMGVYYGEGHPTRAYSLTETPAVNLEQGKIIETGRELDVAIRGEGYFAVETPDGTEAYTRAGSLQVDNQGMLRTGSGLPVLGNGGPIVLPEYEKAEVAMDGTITVVVKGQGPDEQAEVNQLRLVMPEPENLEKGPDGLLRLREDAALPQDPTVQVISGFVESSNVNAVEEFTHMLSLSRQYEMSVKMMQTTQKNSEASAQLLRMT